jgi:MoxR-like ATPase
MSTTDNTAVSPEHIEAQTVAFRERFTRAKSEIGHVIVGHSEIIEGVLLCLLAGGHVLLEGVPGLGKTLLVRTLSQALDLSFSRIQFTPDLMPADITGTNILVEEEGKRQFQFQAGPVFAQIVLADEINRATPKTQSAMLEAMQEKSVTVAGKVRRLHEPFFVLATQNPIEMEGTYPLPEAQMDRFLFKLQVPSPTLSDLAAILDRTTGSETATAATVLNGDEIRAMRSLARSVPIAPHVRDYAASLIMATHPSSPNAPSVVRQFVRFGSSPRGAQAIVLTAKIKAILSGRYNAALEDINAVAVPALRHRVLLNFEGEAEGVDTAHVVQKIIESESASLKTAVA